MRYRGKWLAVESLNTPKEIYGRHLRHHCVGPSCRPRTLSKTQHRGLLGWDKDGAQPMLQYSLHTRTVQGIVTCMFCDVQALAGRGPTWTLIMM